MLNSSNLMHYKKEKKKKKKRKRSTLVRRKWANAHFKKTIQHFAPFPKLIREMPLDRKSVV